MRVCVKCGVTAADGLFFCPGCGARLDTQTASAPRSSEAAVQGHAPTIPSQNPPPMPSAPGNAAPREEVSLPSHRDPLPSMLDESTRAYGRDTGAKAIALPKRDRLSSLVVHPTIAPHVARVAGAVRAKRLSIGVVVEIAVLVACADNDVDEDEYAALEDVVSATLGEIDGGIRSGVVEAAIEKLRGSSYDSRTREVGKAVAAVGAAEDALVLAFALAFASEDLSIPERGVIDALAEAMNAPVDALSRARAIVRSAIDA